MRILRLSWIPPFAVGLAAAVAGEIAVFLLLYLTPGFLRALTPILAVLLSSFALGLWTAPSGSDDTLPERLRRRWVLLLFAFGAAAFVAGIWSVQGGLAAEAYTRGLGLAFLAGLPLYSCGALLGGMAAPQLHVRRAPVGAAAAAGASLGAILCGFVLIATFTPVSIFAFCLVLLSASAIVHGSLIAVDGEKTLSATEQTRYGPVTVEDWSWGKSRRERVLRENGRIRGLEDADGRPIRPWERTALELLSGVGSPGQEADLAAVLLLGAGALTIPRHILARQPEVRLDVVERNQIVLDAAASHFYAPSEGPRLQLIREDPAFGLGHCPGPYHAVVVEACGVAPHDPLPMTDSAGLEALAHRLAPGGTVLIGGVDERRAVGVPLDRLLAAARTVFAAVAVYAPDPKVRLPVGTRASSHEMLLVFSSDPNATFPDSAGGLRLDSRTGPEPTPWGTEASDATPRPQDFPRPSEGGGLA